jgi:CHAD domain-containing protein
VQAECESALQVIADSCLQDFRRYGRAAADGDADALHRLRIALTRLRTAIRFFAPAVDDPAWTGLRRQASWLGRQSGDARDIDVALQRQRAKGATGPPTGPWRERRRTLSTRLRRTLASARYQRFIDALTRQSHLAGDTSLPAGGKKSALSRFSMRRLAHWQSKLLAKGRKLDRLGRRKRHRLRIRAKHLRYALEWSLPLQNERTVAHKQIAQAKLIQDALGKLNDACTHKAQAKTLRLEPLPSMLRLGRKKSRRRLLKRAHAGLQALHKLKTSDTANA